MGRDREPSRLVKFSVRRRHRARDLPGGWRIIRHPGQGRNRRDLVPAGHGRRVRPGRGHPHLELLRFALSTTHVATGSILGTGSARRAPRCAGASPVVWRSPDDHHSRGRARRRRDVGASAVCSAVLLARSPSSSSRRPRDRLLSPLAPREIGRTTPTSTPTGRTSTVERYHPARRRDPALREPDMHQLARPSGLLEVLVAGMIPGAGLPVPIRHRHPLPRLWRGR